MPSAILFDLGDTLIDFEPMDTRALFKQAADRTYRFLGSGGRALPPFEAYCAAQFRAVRRAYLWAKLRGREFNSLHLLRQYCRRHALPHDEASMQDLAWRWYEPLTEHSSVEPELPALLERFRRAGLKLAVVSNTFVPGPAMDRHLAKFGLLEFFPVRIYSSEVGYRKPDRRIFEAALRACGARAADSVFVGDLVKTDIVGARRCGMRTVLKQPWGASRARPAADAVIGTLAELPAALRELDANPVRCRGLGDGPLSPAPDPVGGPGLSGVPADGIAHTL